MLRRCLLIAALTLAITLRAVGADAPTPHAEEAAASLTPPTSAPAEAHAAEKAAPEEAYKSPFPDREELFQPPSAKRPVLRQDANTDSVTLRGFVDVDGARVLLNVNGKVKTLAVGESMAGVEVVIINPPKVTLQRGRIRWTETLFESRPFTPPAPSTETSGTEQAAVQGEEAPAATPTETPAETPVAAPTEDAGPNSAVPEAASESR